MTRLPISFSVLLSKYWLKRLVGVNEEPSSETFKTFANVNFLFFHLSWIFSHSLCWHLGKESSLQPYPSLPYLKQTKTNSESTNMYLRPWFGTHRNDTKQGCLEFWLKCPFSLAHSFGYSLQALKELIWKKKNQRLFNIKQPFHVHKPSVLWLQPAESWYRHLIALWPGNKPVLSWVRCAP